MSPRCLTAQARRSPKPSAPDRWKRGPRRPCNPLARHRNTRTCAPALVRCLPAAARPSPRRPSLLPPRRLPTLLRPSPPTSVIVLLRCAATLPASAAEPWTYGQDSVWTMPRWLPSCNAFGQRPRWTAKWTSRPHGRRPNWSERSALRRRAGAPLRPQPVAQWRRSRVQPSCTMRWPTGEPTPT